MPALIAGRVSIQDVRVVKQEPAEPDERDPREGGDASSSGAESDARQVRPPAGVRLLATNPEQICQHPARRIAKAPQ